MLREIKQLTQSKWPWQAARKIWLAGLAAYKERSTVEELKAAKERMEKEHLENARLVHEYETKILAIVRENEELKKQNKELGRESDWIEGETIGSNGTFGGGNSSDHHGCQCASAGR
ncbi:MAG: hypothetical protein WAQ17_03860 [Limnochordia bacterium]